VGYKVEKREWGINGKKKGERGWEARKKRNGGKKRRSLPYSFLKVGVYDIA